MLALFVVVVAVLASCGDDDDSSHGAGAGAPTTAAAPETTAVADRPLAEVFAPLPQGYSYGDVRPDLADKIRQGAEAEGAASILTDVVVRQVTKGSTPVATIEAFRLAPATSSADRAGFVRGVENSAGGKSSVIKLAGRDATLVAGDVSAVVYESGNTVLFVIGNDEVEVRAVSAVLVGSL